RLAARRRRRTRQHATDPRPAAGLQRESREGRDAPGCASGISASGCAQFDFRPQTLTVPTPLDILWSAVQAHRAQKLDQAEPLYRQSIAADPNNPDAHHLL